MVVACVLGAAGLSRAEAPRPGTTFRDCPDCPEMVVIPAGHFLMGSTEAQAARELATVPPAHFGLAVIFGYRSQDRAAKFMAHEHPQHEVTIGHDFALGKYPVTRGEFAAFVRETGHRTGSCWIFGRYGHPQPPVPNAWANPGFEQSDRDPVVCVTWADMQAYVSWLNLKLGSEGDRPYRLPSEAEWEYAARAGTQTARYWGDDIGFDHVGCNGCPGTKDKGAPFLVDGMLVSPHLGNIDPVYITDPVGLYKPNQFGLYDMLGDASEVTQDCWHDNYDGAPTDGSAWLSSSCSKRSVRGNARSGPPWVSRVTERGGGEVAVGGNDLGFRVTKHL